MARSLLEGMQSMTLSEFMPVTNFYAGVIRQPLIDVPIRFDTFDAASVLASVASFCPALDQSVLSHTCVAGGFVRDCLLGQPPKDLDLYCWSWDEVYLIEELLRVSGWQLFQRWTVVSSWQDRDGKVVQIISTPHAGAVATISSFDFTVCCAAVEIGSKRAVSSATFLCDLARRELRLNRPSSPLDSMERATRLGAAGFWISSNERQRLLRLAAQQLAMAG